MQRKTEKRCAKSWYIFEPSSKGKYPSAKFASAAYSIAHIDFHVYVMWLLWHVSYMKVTHSMSCILLNSPTRHRDVTAGMKVIDPVACMRSCSMIENLHTAWSHEDCMQMISSTEARGSERCVAVQPTPCTPSAVDPSGRSFPIFYMIACGVAALQSLVHMCVAYTPTPGPEFSTILQRGEREGCCSSSRCS